MTKITELPVDPSITGTEKLVNADAGGVAREYRLRLADTVELGEGGELQLGNLGNRLDH